MALKSSFVRNTSFDGQPVELSQYVCDVMCTLDGAGITRREAQFRTLSLQFTDHGLRVAAQDRITL